MLEVVFTFNLFYPSSGYGLIRQGLSPLVIKAMLEIPYGVTLYLEMATIFFSM